MKTGPQKYRLFYLCAWFVCLFVFSGACSREPESSRENSRTQGLLDTSRAIELDPAIADVLNTLQTYAVSGVPVGVEKVGASAKDVLSFIRGCPDWSELGPDDDSARGRIVAALEVMDSYDLDTIRLAMARYMFEASLKFGGMDSRDMGRLFVLNQYLFDLPNIAAPEEVRWLGGWWVSPENSTIMSLQWPFSSTPDGLQLVGGGAGCWYGTFYDALQVFDYYRAKYPRRTSLR